LVSKAWQKSQASSHHQRLVHDPLRTVKSLKDLRFFNHAAQARQLRLLQWNENDAPSTRFKGEHKCFQLQLNSFPTEDAMGQVNGAVWFW
jgi:hypothetical protein